MPPYDRAAALFVADALRRAQQQIGGALRRRRPAHQPARLRGAEHVPQPVAGEQQPRVGAWDGSTPNAAMETRQEHRRQHPGGSGGGSELPRGLTTPTLGGLCTRARAACDRETAQLGLRDARARLWPEFESSGSG